MCQIWLINTPFDFIVQNADINTQLHDELIEMCVDLSAEWLFKCKNLHDYWYNVNIATKYPKFCAAIEPFLPEFLSSYIVEAVFSHANAILKITGNPLNLEESRDMWLNLSNL